MNSILIVEDEEKLARLMADYLQNAGFSPQILNDGLRVLPWLDGNAADLILLDLMLPGRDGLDLCRAIRRFSAVPIIMVTARIEEVDRLLGLELGANDYLVKTTPPTVLLAHIRAQLRQAKAQQPTAPALAATIDSLLVFGKLRIDQANREVTLDGQSISLSTSDFDMLWLLASRAGEILSRDDLLQNLRGVSYDGLDRSIDVAISRLRKKLGDDSAEPQKLKTVRNRGYLFVRNGWDN